MTTEQPQQSYRLGLPTPQNAYAPEPQTHPSIELPEQRAEEPAEHRVNGTARDPEQFPPTSRPVVERNSALFYLVITLAVWGVAIKLFMNWWLLDVTEIARQVDGVLAIAFTVKAAVATKCTWAHHSMLIRKRGRRRA